jgi:hypothetical protein
MRRKTMKKIVAAVLTAVFAVSILSGCSTAAVKAKEPVQSGQPGQNQGITVNKIKFEKLEYEKLSQDKQKLIDKIKTSKGYYFWEEGGSFTIFIASGEKSTGGFGIDVKYVEDNEGKTNILVEEKSPAPGDMVTQAITYPFVIVKATGITNNFNIENTKGEKFSLLQNNKNTIVENAEGTFVGAIDNNFVEIIVDGQPQSFMITEVADKMKNIREDDKVVLSYEKNEHGQLVIKSIEKK